MKKIEKTLENFCKKHNIVFTEIVSPITTNSRLEEINKLNPDLIYAISQNMTTGSKSKFGYDFKKYINNLNKFFSCLVGVGFGVKTKKDVDIVCNNSDFAIIGSEFIKKYNSGGIMEIEKYLIEITK